MKRQLFGKRTTLLAAATTAVTLLAAALRADDALDAKIVAHQPGVRLSLLAEHPQVATPTGIDVDADGNVWVVCSHTHFRPDNYEGPEHDQVVVIGAAGRRVFYQQTTATMDLELGADGWVYLAERSRLLRVRDSDQDGAGDRQQDLAVLTTDADYPHNGICGLAWTKQGELLFALGENYAQDWELRGADGATIRGSGEGGVFLIRADGTRLRRLRAASGIRSASACDPTATSSPPKTTPAPGRLAGCCTWSKAATTAINGTSERRRAHPFVCWDGELPGTLPMVTAVSEAPCGIASFGGGLLVSSWADNRIDYYPLQSAGASFRAERTHLVSGSDVFRPTCIAAGKPGVFYFADWTVGSYQLHGKGRVWKLELDGAADWVAAEPKRAASDVDSLLGNPPEGQTGDAPSTDTLLASIRSDQPFRAHALLSALSRRPSALDLDQFAARKPALRRAAALAAKMRFVAFADLREPGPAPADELRSRWIRRLLSDDLADVRFEGLRWIAEQRLIEFSADVREVLDDAALDFHMFEAALAAWNAVNGNAAAGVSDPDMLLSRVADDKAPSKLRAFSLRLISPRHPKLKVAMLDRLSRSEDPRLAREAVRSLAGHPTPEARKVLERVCLDAEAGAEMKMDALVGLAAAPDDHGPCLSQLAASRHRGVREEALRALRSATRGDKRALLDQLESRFPESRDLIAAARDPLSLSRGRPELSDVSRWLRRLAAVEGPPDPDAGRRIFFSAAGMCANCHRHQGRGHVVGPDLSAVAAAGEPAELLRSLLQPSRDVAPQYHPWQLETADGVVFTGIMLRNGGSGKVVFRDNEGRERTFVMSEVVRRREVKTSMMPDKLPQQLTDRELRDLLAFLTRAEPREADAAEDR